jgi:hypothetical protein
MRAALLALGVLAVITGCQTQGAYAGWVASSVDLERADANLAGPMFGWEGSNGGPVSGFLEVRILEDGNEGLDVGQFNMGLRTRPAEHGRFSVRVQTDIGLATADLDGFQNDNTLVSISLGVQPAIHVYGPVSIVGFLGYRYYFDTTEPTTCNDGSTSTSTGPGTCSHHGGIDHYNDQIGNGGGVEASFGVRFSY